jgi:hypothetical protein
MYDAVRELDLFTRIAHRLFCTNYCKTFHGFAKLSSPGAPIAGEVYSAAL